MLLRLDLASGRGNAAKAALQERLPYTGFVLSESHGRRLEGLLTDFICEQMKEEGSAHYRPEACGSGETEPEPKGRKNTEPAANEPPQKKPRKQPKKTPKTEEAKGEDDAEEGDPDDGKASPLPW